MSGFVKLRASNDRDVVINIDHIIQVIENNSRAIITMTELAEPVIS